MDRNQWIKQQGDEREPHEMGRTQAALHHDSVDGGGAHDEAEEGVVADRPDGRNADDQYRDSYS